MTTRGAFRRRSYKEKKIMGSAVEKTKTYIDCGRVDQLAPTQGPIEGLHLPIARNEVGGTNVRGLREGVNGL